MKYVCICVIVFSSFFLLYMSLYTYITQNKCISVWIIYIYEHTPTFKYISPHLSLSLSLYIYIYIYIFIYIYIERERERGEEICIYLNVGVCSYIYNSYRNAFILCYIYVLSERDRESDYLFDNEIFLLLVQVNFEPDSMPKMPVVNRRIANRNILNFKHKGQVYKQNLQNEGNTSGIILFQQQIWPFPFLLLPTTFATSDLFSIVSSISFIISISLKTFYVNSLRSDICLSLFTNWFSSVHTYDCILMLIDLYESLLFLVWSLALMTDQYISGWLQLSFSFRLVTYSTQEVFGRFSCGFLSFERQCCIYMSDLFKNFWLSHWHLNIWTGQG